MVTSSSRLAKQRSPESNLWIEGYGLQPVRKDASKILGFSPGGCIPSAAKANFHHAPYGGTEVPPLQNNGLDTDTVAALLSFPCTSTAVTLYVYAVELFAEAS